MTVTQGPRLAPGDQWDDTGHEVHDVITLPPPAQEAGLGGAPARQADPGGVPAPHPRPGRAPLRVLPTEHLERRARRRRARLTITVAASLVAGSLLGVVALNVMIAQDQLRLDRLDAQRNAALAQHGQLQLQVAQLQSPARIVAQAEQRLGMVVPSKLTFLSGNGAAVQTTGGGAIPPPLAAPSPPATSPAPPASSAKPPPPPAPQPAAPATVPGSAHR